MLIVAFRKPKFVKKPTHSSLVFMQLEDYFECFVFILNIKLYYNGLLNIRTQLTLVIIQNAFLSGRKQKTTMNHSEQDIDLAMVKTVRGVSLKPYRQAA